MRDRVWHTGVAVLPFLVMWACASESEPPSTTTVRDSAGIAQDNLADGRLVFGGGPIWGGPIQPEEGFSRDRTHFVIAGLDGSLEQSLGEFPGAEIYIRSSEDGVEVVMVPFSKAPAGAAWGNLIYVGISDSYQILVYDAGGDLARIIRLDQDPLPVTPEDTETYIQERVEQVVDAVERRRMEERHHRC